MATPTQITKELPAAIPADALQRGVAIYDAIMELINPDLLSTTYTQLDERYQTETLPAYAARLQQYRRDFSLFKRCLAEYERTLQKHDHALRAAAETQTKAEEEIFQTKILGAIDHQ